MSDSFSSVCVLGLGYIGLPTAVLIASRGMTVAGVDTNKRVTTAVSKGTTDIAEPDLEGLLLKVVTDKQLTASSKPKDADVFIIAVPTPITETAEPDVGAVLAAAKSVAPVLQPGNLVIVESTCPIGTTEQVCDAIREERPDLLLPTPDREDADICVAYCPERVLPGRILTELISNDRCIGGITDRCARLAQKFYKTFVRGVCITTTARTAEMVKLAENAFRDTNIAFANELSMIADRYGIDVWDAIDLANRHPRVNILQPGPGVGGHCIAVDPWFLAHSAPDLAKLIRVSRDVNDGKSRYILDRACQMLDEHSYADAACLGLAFKANVEDLRESPALEIATALAQRYGSRVKVVEPYLSALPEEFSGTKATLMDLDEALVSCEIAIVLVDHDQFKNVPTFDRRHLAVLDARGMWRDMPAIATKPAQSHLRAQRVERQGADTVRLNGVDG